MVHCKLCARNEVTVYKLLSSQLVMSVYNYSALVGLQSIVINPSVCASACVSVCLCLSVPKHISGTAGPIGLVLLRWHCATSGFVDDVTFGRNGHDAGKGWQHSTSAINYVRDQGRV